MNALADRINTPATGPASSGFIKGSSLRPSVCDLGSVVQQTPNQRRGTPLNRGWNTNIFWPKAARQFRKFFQQLLKPDLVTGGSTVKLSGLWRRTQTRDERSDVLTRVWGHMEAACSCFKHRIIWLNIQVQTSLWYPDSIRNNGDKAWFVKA